MNLSKNNRIRYVDYFKAIAIILVVLGHISFANKGIQAWIYSFHMPAFFFAAGFFLKSRTEYGIRDFENTLRKKIQSLALPYLIWAQIYASLKIPNILKILYGSQASLKSAGSLTSLWFLTALFLALLFFEVCKLVLQKRFNLPVKIVLILLAFVIAEILPHIEMGYPWSFNVAFYAFGFLLLGNILYPFLERFHGLVSEKSYGKVICVCAVVLALAGTLIYRLNLSGISKVDTAAAVYGNFLLFVIAALFGTFFIAALAVLLDQLIPHDRDILLFIGQNTFVIFAVHKAFVNLVFKEIFKRISLPSLLELVITCIGALFFSCLLCLFINRYLPLLAGKGLKQDKTAVKN